MANQLVGFDPDPNTPGAGTAKLSDGSTLYGRQSDFAPYVNSGMPIVSGATGLQALAQQAVSEREDAANAPRNTNQAINQQLGFANTRPNQSTGTAEPGMVQPGNIDLYGNQSQSQEPGNPLLSAGLQALGATPRDVAAQYALQQTGRNVDLPTLLAAKKTQVMPGSPAMTPGTEANQFPWRTSMQRTTEGAKPIDEDRWGNVQRLAGEAVEAQSRAQLAEGQAAQETARAQAESAAQLHQQMEAQQARQEASWQDQHQRLLQEVDDASKSEPDQKRWFAEHGAVGSIFAILGSMAQGYGMGLHGQFGPSMLERFVNNDIALQQRQIELRGANARNKLADLSQQYGSLEAGKAALRASQLRLADAQLGQIAATAKQPAIQANIAAQKAQMQKQIAEADYNLRAAAMGTQKTSEAAQYMLPRKATAGGVRTSYNLGGVLEQSNKEREFQSKEGEEAQKQAGTIAEKAEFTNTAIKAADEYAEAAGFVRGKNGQWEAPRGFDHPLFGPIDTTIGYSRFGGLWDNKETESRRLAAQKLEEAAAAGRRAKYTRAAGGAGGEEGGGPVNTHDQEVTMLLGNSPKNSPAAVNSYIENLKSRGQAIRAGQTGRGVEKFNQGLKREERRDQGEGREAARTEHGFRSLGLKE